MRRRFKRIAMLLCVCMMLEPTCSFAQTRESLPEAVSVAETSVPETVTGSEAADGSETADEQDASRNEETTSPESEGSTEAEAESEGTSETEAGTESEEAPEMEAETESEGSTETETETESEETSEAETETESEETSETEAAPKKDSAQKAEAAPKKETSAEPKELVFSCKGDGVSVTARTESGSDIPKDAKLHAEKLKKESGKYSAAYDKVSKSLDLEEGDRQGGL